MNHLSAQDAMFLHIETPEMPMHIGSLCVLDMPPGMAADDFYEHAKERIAQRMHLAELFTRKLARMPFDLSNPAWVEDDAVDLDYHMRHVALPKPGTNRQLQQYVARLHSSLLDRSRPLWEFFIISGLKSGQAALYTKAHHAGMDGQGGLAVAQSIFDFEPAGRVVKPARERVRSNFYQPSMSQLARAAALNAASQVLDLAKGAPGMLNGLKGLLTPARDQSGKRRWGPPRDFKIFGPRTLLNVPITNQRTFAGRTISLAETKFIGKTLGGSLNDVVMTTTAGALRRYLKDHSDLPVQPMLAAVPMSLRAAGDTTANNQVGGMFVTLATDEGDPARRLQLIAQSSTANKAMMAGMNTSMPTDFPLLAAPWLISGLVSAASRTGLITAIPPVANLIISNVPGSPVPLYFAGALLASFYPVSIAIHSMALNVTVQSYAGRLDYGLIACRRAVPDITDLGDHLLAEHQELLARAQEVAGVQTPAPKVSSAPAAAVKKPVVKRAAAATKKAAPAAKKAKSAAKKSAQPALKKRATKT